jgi:hypothetical protein
MTSGSEDTDDCAEHSYGQVQEFLQRRTCAGLHRAYFEVRDRNGDVVLIAVSWVEMPDEAQARDLHELLDSDGTGNITELSRDQGGYRSVRFTGGIYESRRDGTVVVNAQAEAVSGRVAGLDLRSIVTEAVR